MRIDLKNCPAWITGGGEGIGRAIALAAAECGARVAVTDVDEASLQAVVGEITQRGGEAIAIPADVSSDGEMRRAAQQLERTWGRLGFVCANAGTNGVWAPIEELRFDEWSHTLAVNLTGTYLTVHHAVPLLRANHGGSVVVVSSVNGTRVFGNEGASAYATSKAGQLALGQMLALELAPQRIRVNVICPGAIDTEIHEKTRKRDLDRVETPVEYPEGNIPLTGGAMGKPDEVAALAVFLASDAASHISGTPIWIDGAESLLEG